MNSKSKIILGLSSIVAISAAVAATSSYAWFTTSRTATMTVSNIVVDSPSGKLIANATTKDDTNGGVDVSASSGSTTNDTITGTGYTVDVSGTGEITSSQNDFYQPAWGIVNQGTTAESMRAHVANTDAVHYFREFYITFTNDGTQGDAATEKFQVYLNENSSIAPSNSKTDADVNAAKAIRVGFYTVDANATTATLLTIWDSGDEGQTKDDQHPYRYNFVDDLDKTAADAANAKIADEYTNSTYGLASYSFGDMDKFAGGKIVHGTPATVSSTMTAAQKTAQLLTPQALDGKDTYKILVRIWIEGTSRFCTDSALKGSVKMTFGFSALV